MIEKSVPESEFWVKKKKTRMKNLLEESPSTHSSFSSHIPFLSLIFFSTSSSYPSLSPCSSVTVFCLPSSFPLSLGSTLLTKTVYSPRVFLLFSSSVSISCHPLFFSHFFLMEEFTQSGMDRETRPALSF